MFHSVSFDQKFSSCEKPHILPISPIYLLLCGANFSRALFPGREKLDVHIRSGCECEKGGAERRGGGADAVPVSVPIGFGLFLLNCSSFFKIWVGITSSWLRSLRTAAYWSEEFVKLLAYYDWRFFLYSRQAVIEKVVVY